VINNVQPMRIESSKYTFRIEDEEEKIL